MLVIWIGNFRMGKENKTEGFGISIGLGCVRINDEGQQDG